LIPGALGGEDAAEKDSFSDDLLEHAHYTRPGIFEGQEVPGVLLSGHHQEIEKWRLESSVMRTLLKRPDLLQKKDLNRQERDILKKWRCEIEKLLDPHQSEKKGF
jgi:tRNA (guanine37-N1)-methyltransferase